MPIKSYLAHPHDGKKMELIDSLSTINNCQVIPSENEELLIVVTETENYKEEDLLKEKIEAIESLRLLAMVSGFDTPKNN